MYSYSMIRVGYNIYVCSYMCVCGVLVTVWYVWCGTCVISYVYGYVVLYYGVYGMRVVWCMHNVVSCV